MIRSEFYFNISRTRDHMSLGNPIWFQAFLVGKLNNFDTFVICFGGFWGKGGVATVSKCSVHEVPAGLIFCK